MNPGMNSSFDASGPQQPDLLDSSMRLLEFDLVREKLAGHTRFPMSRELAEALRPSTDHSEVSSWLEEAEEARRNTVAAKT